MLQFDTDLQVFRWSSSNCPHRRWVVQIARKLVLIHSHNSSRNHYSRYVLEGAVGYYLLKGQWFVCSGSLGIDRDTLLSVDCAGSVPENVFFVRNSKESNFCCAKFSFVKLPTSSRYVLYLKRNLGTSVISLRPNSANSSSLFWWNNFSGTFLS